MVIDKLKLSAYFGRLMDSRKHSLKICGIDASVLNGNIEVSVADESVASDIMIKMSAAILDKKINSLRINMPNKIIFITAKDQNHILVRAEESDNKKIMN